MPVLTKPFLYPLIALILTQFSVRAVALKLFDQDLASVMQDQMRNAVKQSGVKLISEAGKNAFFDVYEGKTLLHNAQRLYLGFVKKDRHLAFVEYEFKGLQQPAILERLTRRYGKPQQKSGHYLTDNRYQWQVDGVKITLYQDWPAYKTRLDYIRSQALQQLRAEQANFVKNRRKQRSRYNEKAY